MYQINNEKFGHFLAEVRKEKQMTQKDLADKLFVSDKTVSKWERGNSMPNVTLLIPIADVLGITVTELLQGEKLKENKTLNSDVVETLVVNSLDLSLRDTIRQRKKNWIFAFLISIGVVVIEAILLTVSGISIEQMGDSLYISLLMLLFASWLCIFAKELEACGVDTLHVAQANHTGNMGDTIPAMGTQPYGFMVSYSKKIKELVSIPVSVVGRIVTPEAAEAVIANGSADIIGLGRSLLTDPDFANKCADGHCCNVRTCMMCNKGCTDNIQNRAFLSCVLNAENGYEGSRQITPAASTKNIAIIGAGIAGLEAARVAALRGHSVTIFEKSLQIGGQLLIASVPPRKEEMMRSINYYANVLPELDVTFRLGEEFTSQDYNSFDEVIVATGANNAIIPVPGKDLPTVTSAWDVLAKKEIVFGNVSVIGGGLVGVETAEYLASRGCKVTIIEMMDQIAKEESNTVLPTLMSELEHYNVQIVTSAKLSEIKDDSVVVEKTIDDNTSTEEIASDFVVMAVGARKNLPELSDCPLPLHYIGDCAGERPSNIDHAIKSAYDVACEI